MTNNARVLDSGATVASAPYAGASDVLDRSKLSRRADRAWARLLLYGAGEGANSLVMNGLAGFAMLYYTQALGLSPALAGLALSLSVFWEGLTEPAMGHISDRTRSRFGNRHPWMLAGGLLMAVCFYMVWSVPTPVRGDQHTLFVYLLIVNLLLRTGLTMFFIPYLALGFEVAPSYDGRARLQGVRQICNMAANFAGPALAWSVFFRDTTGPAGTVPGTSRPENFALMGAAFAIAIVVLVAVALLGTRHAIRDTRALAPAGGDGALRGFLRELKTTVLDPNAVWLFGFTFLVCAGMVLVSSLQMYVYVYFMSFSPEQKSLAHGSTMIGMACGAALSAWAVRRFDKKATVLAGAGLSIAVNLLLALIFLPGWVPTGGTSSVLVFVVLHAGYWFGNGLVLPVATAMVGDAAELRNARTGRSHDGGYAAVFSLAMRLAMAASFAASGAILSAIGFEAQTGGTLPAASSVWRLGAAMLLSGPVLCVAAMLVVMRYPLSRARFAELRGATQPHP